MKNKEAVKSMTFLMGTLILLIIGWMALAYLLFPEQPAEDRYTQFIAANGPLMTQMAENAMDGEKWAGIMSTEQASDLMEKGDILSVSKDEGGAAFTLKHDMPGQMRILYRPDGQYTFSREGEWTLEKSEGVVRRWVGGLGTKGYVNLRRLGDCFYLEEVYDP